ncbi:MAG: glycosyltransferase family 9 protein [Ignavibacteriaceae bacterium]
MLKLNEIKNILIIRLSSLGDILLTTPLIRSLNEKYSGIKVDFVLREQYEDLLKYNNNIENLFLYKKDNSSNVFLFNEFKKRNYDLVVDLQNNLRSAEIRRKLKVRSTIFDKKTFDKFFLVHFKLNRFNGPQEIPKRYGETLPGFNLDDKGLELFYPVDIKPELNDDVKYIGIAPGSRHFSKMWPKQYFIDLCKMLLNDGFRIVIFGGKSDINLCAELTEKIPGSLNLCNEDKILLTAVNIKKCQAVICNDSGLMHAATAVGTPVLAIFGSTVTEFGFAPYKSKNSILENKLLTCRPCTHIGRESCPKKHFKCMLELTPVLAYTKLKEILN